MSVLIKNMDMPNGCRHCELLINCDDCEGYECFCSAMGSDIGYFEDLSKTQRHKDCPLVEVKTPHGRLIDADILYEKFAELDAQALEHTCNLGDEGLNEEWRKWSAILAERTAYKHDVYDAPTVIESEE